MGWGMLGVFCQDYLARNTNTPSAWVVAHVSGYFWGWQRTSSMGSCPCLAGNAFFPCNKFVFYLKVCLLVLLLLGDCNALSFPCTGWRKSFTFVSGPSGTAVLALHPLLAFRSPMGMSIPVKDAAVELEGVLERSKAPSHLLHLSALSSCVSLQWCYLVVPWHPSQWL